MWPIEYVELKRIDELLQCGICYDYMDTSVITSCSHSYCSLCIRKYLHYKTQCPICYEETFEKDLRKNKLLDEIIVCYLDFKDKHGKKLYQEKLMTAKHEDSEIMCSTSTNSTKCKNEVFDINEISPKRLDSPILKIGNTTPHRQKDFQPDISTPSTSTEFRIPLMFTPKSRKDFQKGEDRQIVTCPVCKVEVSQNNINRHLDDCLKRENAKDQPKISAQKRKPLPKLVLSLMKDNVIRKRLKELGLSSQGDRKTLENRLQRYMILYNAECDKTNPRSVSELIKQCEEEENLEKKVQKPSNKLNVNKNTEHNIIEQQRKKYSTNKESFDQLIAKVKHRNSSQKMSARRNILNKKDKKDSDISYNDDAIEKNSTIGNGQKNDFLPLNSMNIEDSDSNISYSLQINPMNFLTTELASSSNDSIDQCASNDDTSNRLYETNSISFNSIIPTENIKIDKPSFENTLVSEEMASSNSSRQYNVSEDEMDVDNKKSVFELFKIAEKKIEQTKLSVKRNENATKHSPNKYIAYSKNEWQRELRDEDLIEEDTEHFVKANDNIDFQDNFGKSYHEQLNKKEEYASGSTKFEKENMKALYKNLAVYTPRKRERDIAFALSGEEKIGDKMMNSKKSFRLSLCEAKGFNNENISEVIQDEEKLQSEKVQSQVIHTKNIHNVERKSVRLKNKISKISN
ncbi:E3 ubiquitin-protein ligase RAD18-like isoform X2 [Pogonomyrmex barbatus]|uniref:RING-type E3 ubiquitin transferase n=1 Tax=Pogonomyrmex barbatus TaxID=144034 RepID=A0A6I9VYK3_9HYME|nr:E3 ubiquitin-protein ligase RAD18-like isoform X2 [Pogonomyrmex barbatus]